MFRIHVVSLARSNRREAISAVLQQNNAAFCIADAIDARAFSDAQFESLYDDGAARERYGRAMTRAEVACFMSHRAVWEKIADSGRAAVVLEDDALLEPKFFKRFLRIQEHNLIDLADIVQLGRSKLGRERMRSVALHEPLKRSTVVAGMRVGFPFKQWTSGAVGYWMSAHAARQALNRTSGKIGVLLDDWPFYRDEVGLRVVELRPYVVWEAFETMPSSIEPERGAYTQTHGALHSALRTPLRVLRTSMRWLVVVTLHLRRISSHG